MYVNYTSKELLKNVKSGISKLGKIIGSYHFFSACVYFPNFLDSIFITLILKMCKNYFQKSYTIHSVS